ncbi:MAG TPA: hypothetical protein VFS40_14905 [Gemmatimonadales bacterium]|nr:hypothetical protein [Gemmatimonadales bacterium]
MSTTVVMVLLRIAHIVAGMFWVGSALFVTFFLMPTMRALGPGGRPVMGHLTQQLRLPTWIMWTAVLTILSGIGLYWRLSGGFASAWIHSGAGRVFGLGGALAIVSFVMGLVVNKPTAARMGALAAAMERAGGPPAPEQAAELARLQRRLYLASIESAILLTLATAAMACARYVG